MAIDGHHANHYDISLIHSLHFSHPPLRQLLLRWKLPPMRRGWLAPAGDILARIIGHEGAGYVKITR